MLTVDGNGLRCNSFAALPPNELTQLRVVLFYIRHKRCMNRLYLGWCYFVLYITLVLWLHTGEMKGAHP